jgi:hypothetical protein
MLFEQQRLLLTLLDAVGEPVGHTDFQKLLLGRHQGNVFDAVEPGV